MVDLARQNWRDYEVDGVAASGKHKPKKSKLRQWGTWVEGIITAFTSNGGLIYTTRTLLYADLGHAANASAWVVGDSTVAYNGIYQKSGISGAGAWTRVADLPYSFIACADAGAGTANAIQLLSTIPAPSAARAALFFANVFEDNTGAVTVSINGASAKPMVTNTGVALQAGYLAAGMQIAFVDDGTNYRLMTDVVSASIVAAAAASADAAAASAADAAASAAAVPRIVDNFADLAALVSADVPVDAYVQTGEGALFQRTASGGDLNYSGTGGIRLNIVGRAETPYLMDFGIVTNSLAAATANATKFQAAITKRLGKHIILPDEPFYCEPVLANTGPISIFGHGKNRKVWYAVGGSSDVGFKQSRAVFAEGSVFRDFEMTTDSVMLAGIEIQSSKVSLDRVKVSLNSIGANFTDACVRTDNTINVNQLRVDDCEMRSQLNPGGTCGFRYHRGGNSRFWGGHYSDMDTNISLGDTSIVTNCTIGGGILIENFDPQNSTTAIGVHAKRVGALNFIGARLQNEGNDQRMIYVGEKTLAGESSYLRGMNIIGCSLNGGAGNTAAITFDGINMTEAPFTVNVSGNYFQTINGYPIEFLNSAAPNINDGGNTCRSTGGRRIVDPNVPDLATTVSLAKGNFFIITNSAPTTIASFTGVVDDQKAVDVFVTGNGNTTINFAATAISGNNELSRTFNKDVLLHGVKHPTTGRWVFTGGAEPSLLGSAIYDPPSIAAGAETTTTVTVTGAAVGDIARAAFSIDSALKYHARVSAANTVTVTLRNDTAGAIDLASGTLRAIVEKVV